MPIITFGGPYSNHLTATAVACKTLDIPVTAILKGDKMPRSATLDFCRSAGMQLELVSREFYRINSQDQDFSRPGYITIPEGGYGHTGVKGATLMMNYINPLKPGFIICACGTATTVSGLVAGNANNAEIICVPAIRNMHDIAERINFLSGQSAASSTIWNEYDFGGYARYDQDLIDFMNRFYNETGIPTDFVYTAKMLFTLEKKLAEGYFQKGSNILAVHTGGLQGNNSLKEGTLIF